MNRTNWMLSELDSFSLICLFCWICFSGSNDIYSQEKSNFFSRRRKYIFAKYICTIFFVKRQLFHSLFTFKIVFLWKCLTYFLNMWRLICWIEKKWTKILDIYVGMCLKYHLFETAFRCSALQTAFDLAYS